AGKTVVLQGSSSSAGAVTWTCNTGNLSAKYLPSNCR
ncbi:hypothetical protein FAS41_08110, partial [Pseudomonas nicosulfuronedens]